jgi:hypothetical protein
VWNIGWLADGRFFSVLQIERAQISLFIGGYVMHENRDTKDAVVAATVDLLDLCDGRHEIPPEAFVSFAVQSAPDNVLHLMITPKRDAILPLVYGEEDSSSGGSPLIVHHTPCQFVLYEKGAEGRFAQVGGVGFTEWSWRDPK